MHSPLGLRLRELRVEQGLSLREAANKTHVDRDTIREIELGERRPFGRTLGKLSEGYGVPLRELLELEEPVPLSEAPQEPGQSGQEWARELGAELHGMTDAEWTAHVRALGTGEEIVEESRKLLDEAKKLHAAFAKYKRQRPGEKERRAALSKELRELRMDRYAELAAAARKREDDEAFWKVVQDMAQDRYEVAAV